MTPETELEIYRAVMRRIEALMGAKADSPEGAELHFLVTVAESYEERTWSINGVVSSQKEPS
jgi:hypothetical protein